MGSERLLADIENYNYWTPTRFETEYILPNKIFKNCHKIEYLSLEKRKKRHNTKTACKFANILPQELKSDIFFFFTHSYLYLYLSAGSQFILLSKEKILGIQDIFGRTDRYTGSGSNMQTRVRQGSGGYMQTRTM